MVLLLRLGRSRSILVREGVWKPLGLHRLRRSLLGGGIILRSSVETLSRCLMLGWKNIRAFYEANLAHDDYDDTRGIEGGPDSEVSLG